MRTARTIAASLAAVLVTAALNVGAAAADLGKANVNVPPADTGHTAASDEQRYITAISSLTPSSSPRPSIPRPASSSRT
jgi:hypothetical protein